MTVAAVIVAVLVAAAVVAVLSAPLREARRARAERGEAAAPVALSPSGGGESDRDALEAAREAKYREIRDAELDYRTGKLSREDYEAIDRTLRAEAIEILDRLQAAGGGVTPRDASAGRSR